VAGVVKEAGKAGAGEGGLLGEAQGSELAVQVLREVGGGVGKGSTEAAAGSLAVGIKPWLVVMVGRAAGAGGGLAGWVGSGGVVEEALLQQQGSLWAGKGGEVGGGQEGVGGEGGAVLGEGCLCGVVAEAGDGWRGRGGR
jgi:hypothetical protein